MSRSSYWPSMVDYQEALQSPSRAFTSSELRSGTPVANKLGLPRPICGTFASVYELVDGRRRWAVKCFLRNTPNLHERYVKISEHLGKCRGLRYFVTFEYLKEGILVRGEMFPLVKMEWVKGSQLNTFIEQNLSRPRVLEKLEKRWDKLTGDLRHAQIAHGDLQHGNILVRPNGELRLIDYDGMWVPTLEGEQSNELGHQDYQIPWRNQHDFHAGIDAFSDAVILIAIRALRQERGLWEKHNNGDNLLFRSRDFLYPRTSRLIADLQALGDDRITEKLEFVLEELSGRERGSGGRAPPRKAKGKAPRAVKASRSAAGPRKEDSRTPGPAAWLRDYVKDYCSAPRRPTSSPQSSGPGVRGKRRGR